MATETMRLCDAIRLGAMATKKATKSYFVLAPSGEVEATCAIGAALYAFGKMTELSSVAHYILHTYYPWFTASIFGDIIHQNDYQSQSREQIADWIEATYEQPAAVKEEEKEQTYDGDGITNDLAGVL